MGRLDSRYVRVADSQTRFVSIVHSLLVVAGAFLTGLVLASVLLSVLSALGIGAGSPIGQAGTMAAQFVGFGLAVGGYVYLREDYDLVSVDVPSLRDLAWVLGGLVGISVVSSVLSAAIAVFVDRPAQNQVVELGRSNPELFLYMLPITILLVGPTEELLFRGVVQGLFRRAYGLVPGIVIASALFGVVHLLALGSGTSAGRFAYVFVAAGMGLVLGTLYEYTGNLFVPALVHGLWNAAIFASLYASTSIL